jgi:hypothetical protein
MPAASTRRFIALAAWCALVQAPAHAQETSDTVANTAFYVRSDTDRTTIVTPRLHVGAPLAEETRVDFVYTVDVWSSASIDIRTAATRRVTEQRDEIDVALEHGLPDTTLGASYRYSTEYDYESHGGTLGVARELANKSATAALTATATFDQVGRAGDPDFDEPASTLSVRATFTQLLDAETFVTGIYELSRQSGFLSSPYRYVRFAGSEEELPRTCVLPVQRCLIEKNPDGRLRHALALSGRRALSSALSVGAGYRFYLDDWDVMSHTATVDGALLLDGDWLLSLGYRFYQQSKAAHYQPFYLAMEPPRYYTSDKELSTMSSHRLDLEVGRGFELDAEGTALRTVLLAAPTYYQYDDFPLLDSITAIELTLSVEVRL